MQSVISGSDGYGAAVYLQSFFGIHTIGITGDGECSIGNVDKSFFIIVCIFTVDPVFFGI